MTSRILTPFVVLLTIIATVGAQESATQPIYPTGEDVIAVARSFEDGGGYKWAGTGACETITHEGKTVLAKGTEGTYCCGFTFNVAMNVARDFGLLKDKSFDEVKQFQRNWYGVSQDKEIVERQPARAIVDLGLGHAVKIDDAQPGDFLQFWRGKSGHSVVFLDWVEKDGKRVGFTYRSSQPATNGIGDHTEYFKTSGIKGGEVDPQRMFFARFGPSKE